MLHTATQGEITMQKKFVTHEKRFSAKSYIQNIADPVGMHMPLSCKITLKSGYTVRVEESEFF